MTVYLLSYRLLFARIVPEYLQWLTALATAYLIRRSMASPARGLFMTAASWAAIAGATFFCGGFFGPIIFPPDANQGPLLGLFITGPLGFIGGGICGLIYALWRRPRAAPG